ncbi:unnamed protein product, partial [Didymodactylos carnosus]
NPSYKTTEQSQLQQHETHHQPQSEVSDVNDANDKPAGSTTLNSNVAILASTSSSSVTNDQQALQQQKVKTKSIRTASQNNARNKIRHRKLKEKLIKNTITRPICNHRPMTLIKQVLHHQQIPRGKTPYPQHGELPLRFKTAEQATTANVDLPQGAFNEEKLQYWAPI